MHFVEYINFLSYIGRQLIFSASADFMLDLSFRFNQNFMHSFWGACKYVFNILYLFGYQALHAYSNNDWIIAMHSKQRKGF